MRPAASERELLRALASMPFLDRLEMACLTGRSRGAVYEAVRRLENSGLAESVPHAAALIPPTRRYRLTTNGLRRLAQDENVAVDALLRDHPVSARWRRVLLERLDAVASVYRLASAVASVAHPVGLRLYRAGPLDAAMLLPGGRTVGVVRQGLAADRTGFAKRLWRLGRGPLPGAVLVLASDEVRLRHARQLLARTSVPALLALERDAVLAGADAPVWRLPSANAALDLRSALEGLIPGGELPTEPPPSKATLPSDIAPDDPPALPARLKPAGKRALDLLSDWPWILQKDLAGLMAVSETRVSRLMAPLEGFGLVAHVAAAGDRPALTDRGLALLARRNRASVGVARKRWSVAPIDPTMPLSWRNLSGGRVRQLLRNLEHTAAVHGFLAALARQSRALGWEVAQLDPPHRASRRFRYGDAWRSVNPDAFGVLRRGPVTRPFFLEWERRAVRPGTMAARLAPYLRYYSSHRPTDDHGVRPAVLVVFDDDIAATHFLRVAQEEMERARVEVPLRVSHREAVAVLGPLEGPGAPQAAGNPPTYSSNERQPMPIGRLNAMCSHSDELRGPSGCGGRTVVRLKTTALWERLARQIGVSPGYISMLVNGERAPSGRIRLRMLRALGVDDFHQLFRLEDQDDDP